MAETLGSLSDKLMTVVMKLFHQETLAQEPGADDHQVAEAKRKISILNLQRNSLVEEIDTFLQNAIEGKVKLGAFAQLKDYRRKI